MENKKPATVASKLLPLFLQQGAPMILQSDNGREFVAKVIEELMKIWKDCKIVHGSPCHPQSQGSVERANADVESMVTQWMEDEKSKNWSWGIKFIAHKKNNRYHEGIKQIPYVLRYGQPCRVGLSRMNLPPALVNQLQSEEQLEEVMAQATIITAPQVAAARSAEAPTSTTIVQTTVVTGKVNQRQFKKRTASTQEADSTDYQPGEYELKVIQKRKRNEERLLELGLGGPGSAATAIAITNAGAKAAVQPEPTATEPVVVQPEPTATEPEPTATEPLLVQPEPTTVAVHENNATLISFGRCSLNERCKGPKRTLTERCPG
jgi:hypothetical protein